MRRIVDGVHVRCWLPMVSRISPRSCRGGTIKLMMLLAGYAWNLHGGYRVHVVRCQDARTPCCWSFRRVLHARDRDRVALVRLTVTKTFGEWIAGDLELSDTMILVSCNRGKSSFREGEGFEILCAGVGRGTWRRGCHHDVTPWLIPVHRVQDYL